MSAFLKPGHLFKNGDIEVIDLVGSGGVGEVYRASMLCEGSRKLVALKVFNPQKLQIYDIEAIEMVQRESLAVSHMHHPNIVQILEISLEYNLPYVVEEFLSGGNLAEAIANRKKQERPGKPIFSALEIASMGHQICAGLMLMHQNNQFHGDLKPSNLCFRTSNSSEIVIVDFGHAGFLEGNLLDRNEHVATLAYIPPERTGFVELAGNANSDLYSLGVTLYEAAVGRVPFSGKDNRDIVNRLLYEVPKPLSEVFPDFPEALSDIISKLLRKSPKDRYHSAFGLAADLERCLKGLQEEDKLPGFALGTKDKLRELNYRIPMIGRDQEMARLHDMFDHAYQGGAAVALIGAPSGTGKSRLAFEVLHRARQKLCFISYVKYSEYERNLPLSALTVLLVEHTHYLKTRSRAELEEWQNKIAARLGPRGQLIADRFPCYEGLLPSFPKAVDQSTEFQFFNQCLAEFLGLLAVSGETQLVLIDDLQWADWQSLQVLGLLADAIWDEHSKKIMFMGTYRSNEVDLNHPLTQALLDRCPKDNLIELKGLGRPDSDLLISSLLEEQGPEIAKLQDLTYRFTEGNPFYIYEYLKSAIHTGIFALDEETRLWRFHEERIHQANLSTSVADLVADRIRTLSQVNQALIAIASLAGHSMNRRALLDILPLLLKVRGLSDERPELQDKNQAIELAYQEFLQKNLLVPDNSNFRFFHDKIQEAAYSILTDDERLILHPAYGMWCAREMQASQENGNEARIFEAAYHLCKGDNKILEPFARRFLIDAAKTAVSLFSYDKAKDYLYAVIAAQNTQEEIDLEEKFEALMMLANTLTISDQVSEALKLYDELLEFDCTPLQRASINCKKSEFGLSVFEYQQARDASIAGLKSLGARFLTSELFSYLYILFFVPILIVYAIYFKFFGRQTKEITDDTEKLRFQLILKNQMSQYFILPVVAIANLVMVTFELLSYKDCTERATIFRNWAISLCPFGLTRLGSKFLARSYDYFDRTANPVEKAIVLWVWGFCCDMPAGNLLAAQKKLEEAVGILAPIGESFWRTASLIGLLLLDYFGAETGHAGIMSYDVIENWKKLQFVPTPLGLTLRHFLEDEREDQLAFILDMTHQAAVKLNQQGFDSIDSIMAWLSLGEYHELKGDYALATDLLRRATWLGLLRLHRANYVVYAPIVFARTLIHQKQYRKALVPLAICWFNQLLNVRLYMPQTLFVTGYWLNSIGWKRTGQRIIESGIEYARKRNWSTIASEGRLLIGRLMVNQRPEMALVYLQIAKDYFQQRSWKFHSKLCDQQIVLQKLVANEHISALSESEYHTTLSTKRGAGIRQKIEMKSLFEVLLKLSAISQKETLFQSIMESLCHATGSELALLIFKEGEHWTPQYGHNIVLQSGDLFSSRVDLQFVERCTKAQIRQPLVRNRNDESNVRQMTSGSAMMVPMIYEAQIHGYCYLANTQIYDLFDAQSMEIAAPIAIQGAIALQNITLNNELAIERDQLSELHRTLEQRVMAQTRDIKSIMQHIKMGICTVSGLDISIDKDYSLFLEQLFHTTDLSGKALLPMLLADSQLGEDEKDQVKNVIKVSMNELEVAFHVNDHLLPRNIRGTHEGGAPFVLELDWIPISNESRIVDKILVTINDVTALRGLEERAIENDRELLIISEILGCSHREWMLFINSSENFLQQNIEHFKGLTSGLPFESLLRKIFINLHTIKGNARALGCKLMNETIHGIEQYFSHMIRNPEEPLVLGAIEEKLTEVAVIVHRYRDVAENKLGRTTQSGHTIPMSRDQLLELYGMMSGVEKQGFVQTPSLRNSLNGIREALFLSVETTFQQLFAGIETLAIDLGKAKPKVKVDTPNIWVTDQGDEIIRNSFMHLIRNSLDHGIEPPEERLRKGKKAEGTIEVSSRIRLQFIDFRLTDDGRGLNLRKIAALGLERGLITQAQTQDDMVVAALIFATDFSTSESLSDISGRGVGMTAVAHYVQEVGGSIQIDFLESRPDLQGFRPFAFVISLPLSLFQTESNQRLSA